MAKQVKREIWAYDTMAEFIADGGAVSYGAGEVQINGSMYESDGITIRTNRLSWEKFSYRKKMLIFGCSIAEQCTPKASTSNTTTTAIVPIDSNVIPVASAAAFSVGSGLYIKLYTGRIFKTVVTDVTGLNITIADPLPAFARLAAVVSAYVVASAANPNMTLAYGAANAAVMMLGSPVELVSPYGYGGAYCKEMMPDLERDLRFYNPDYALFHMFENDFITADSTKLTIEQMKVWSRNIAEMCQYYGCVPIVCSSMPNNVVPASREADYYALKDYLIGQFMIDVPGSYGVDLSTQWVDDSNPSFPVSPAAGWTDGVHPLLSRIFDVAAFLSPQIKDILPPAESLLRYAVTPLEATRLDGTGGTATNLGVGSVVPAGYTIRAAGTAIGATSRNADGSLKITGSWPGAANRTADYINAKYTFTPPKSWLGTSKTFKVFARIRLNTRVGIAQLFSGVIPSAGETNDGASATDQAYSIPADGSVIVLESNAFTFYKGVSTTTVELNIRPIAAVSPANAAIDIDLIELGLIEVTPNIPDSFI